MSLGDPIRAIGGPDAVPRIARMPQASDGALSTLEGFVLSRIDGRTKVSVVSQLVGRPIEEVAEIMLRLEHVGLVDLQRPASMTSPTRAAAAPSPWARASSPTSSRVSSRATGPVVEGQPRAQATIRPAQTSFRPAPSDGGSPHQAAPSPSRFGMAGRGKTLPPSARPWQTGESSPHEVGGEDPSYQRPGRFGRDPSLAGRGGQASQPTAAKPWQRTPSEPGRWGSTERLADSRLSVVSRPQAPATTFAERAERVLGFVPPLHWPVSPEAALAAAAPASSAPAMEEEMREVVAYYAANVDRLSPSELLGGDVGNDAKQARRRYFELSRVFHPDQWFRLDIGPYADDVHRVFRALTAAYDEVQRGSRRARTTHPTQAVTTASTFSSAGGFEIRDPTATHEIAPPREARRTQEHPAITHEQESAYAMRLRADAQAHRQSGDLDLAWEAMQKASHVSPSTGDFQELAVLALEMKKPLSVVQDALTKSHQLGDRSARWYSLAGECALRAGNLQAAARGFQRALLIDPDEPLSKRRMEAIERLRSGQQPGE